MLLRRANADLSERSKADVLRKIIHYVAAKNPCGNFLRQVRAYRYFKQWKLQLGRNVILNGLFFDISVGEGLNIYDHAIVDCGSPQAQLRIGKNCLLSYGALISCAYKITLGDNVMIGEYTSVRDSTHNYKDLSRPMMWAGDIPGEIQIGNDVWIGRGCLITPGAIIEDGVVVGANSIVKGRLESFGIYAGAPAKLIKMRS